MCLPSSFSEFVHHPSSDIYLKLNTDASWSNDLQRDGIGWILRDQSGSIINAGHKCVHYHWYVDLLEALAILDVISFIPTLSCPIVVESD